MARQHSSETSVAGHRVGAVIKWTLAGIGLILVFILFYGLSVVAHCPKINPGNIYSNLAESSILYDCDGNVMENIYTEDGNRVNIDYSQMPKNLVNAFVATEDKTFWQHHGFNVVRMFGAVYDSFFHGGRVAGTSTITQQLARNVYLPESKSRRTVRRKVIEAWYTVLLEHKLSKQQIIEAYLNSIYFGYNAYGVQAASQAYFSCDAKDLNLEQCVALASIPRSPNYYSLVRVIDNKTIESEALRLKKKDILRRTGSYTVVYNGDTGTSRRLLTLRNMKRQHYISDAAYRTAAQSDLKAEIDLEDSVYLRKNPYFTDYVISEVIADLKKEGYSEEAAEKMVYTGGLSIHTTLDQRVQNAIDAEFASSSNFPGLQNLRYDSSGNILDSSGRVLLYRYRNFFNAAGDFSLHAGEFKRASNGSLLLRKGHRLDFVRTSRGSDTDISIRMKDLYRRDSSGFYSIEGTVILVPKKYKTLTSRGNLRIDASFFRDHPDFCTFSTHRCTIHEDGCTLGQEIRQPQGAMVITDYTTGEIRGMAGGRDESGAVRENRAVTPNQPGSSIKPLSVYSTALTAGEEAAEENNPMTFRKLDKNERPSGYGEYWTAASRIHDAPLTVGGTWSPHNAYSGYRGMLTMRKALEISSNTCAVRVFRQIGVDDAIDQLKKFGITSVVESGASNDRNAAALALGGMTRGISPLEMAAAYGTFPRRGEYIPCRSYTKVLSRSGKVLLKAEEQRTTVLSSGVAFILTDMMRDVVTRGTGKNARTPQVTAGKTGTTSDSCDAWFCGFTPQYAAACWIGSDQNLALTGHSETAALLWGRVMKRATRGMHGSLPSQPSTVVRSGGEYYIRGTQPQPKVKQWKPLTGTYRACSETGYRATPDCPRAVKKKVMEDPYKSRYYCPLHNSNPGSYPLPPGYGAPIYWYQE
ncbi:MAG: transglycosylase domain-containing protein [Anaerovoracaceae bacterium]|jgi:penicillin-binding protein 1A